MADKDFDGGLGIGGVRRVPETTIEDGLEAQRRQPTKPTPRFTCSHCGRSFPRVLAMSSSSGTVCPDCYDDASY